MYILQYRRAFINRKTGSFQNTPEKTVLYYWNVFIYYFFWEHKAVNFKKLFKRRFFAWFVFYWQSHYVVYMPEKRNAVSRKIKAVLFIKSYSSLYCFKVAAVFCLLLRFNLSKNEFVFLAHALKRKVIFLLCRCSDIAPPRQSSLLRQQCLKKPRLHNSPVYYLHKIRKYSICRSEHIY